MTTGHSSTLVLLDILQKELFIPKVLEIYMPLFYIYTWFNLAYLSQS